MRRHIVVVAFAFVFASGLAGAAVFGKGQRVTLNRDSVLLFENTPYRRAAQGEEFDVVESRPDLGRVYVLATDGHGLALTLSIDANALSLVVKDSPTPGPPAESSPTATAESQVSPVSKVEPDHIDKDTSAPEKAEVNHEQKNESHPHIEKATYLVKTDKGRGSAFSVRLNGRTFLVTNFHVLKGATTVAFSSLQDTINLAPNSAIEVATDRDMVRIPLAGSAELVPGESPSINDSIDVFGNPGGAQVITDESGKVLGVGPSEIEVSAKFIQGNSGGPIVQANTDNVFGVATYISRRQVNLAEWTTKKTRFEEPRRFGLRLSDSIQWSKASWAGVSSDGLLIESVEAFYDEALKLARLLASTPYRSVFTSKIGWSREIDHTRARQDYDALVAKYNATCNEFSATRGRLVTSGTKHQVNLVFSSRVASHAAALGKCLEESSAELGRTNHEFSTQFTRSDYQHYCQVLAELGTYLNDHVHEIGDRDLFR